MSKINTLPAETMAEAVYRKYNSDMLATDLIHVAKSNNIAVKTAIFRDPNICACIEKTSSSTIIFVAESLNAYQMKYWIAHTLGHFFLHLQREFGQFVEQNDGRKMMSLVDQEADHFACGLLAPKFVIQNLLKRINNVLEIANVLNVPIEFMEHRLCNLGYLNISQL